MQIKTKQKTAALLSVSLILVVIIQPFVLAGSPVSFNQGDRWCAVGDSITHSGSWLKYIYLYYATRFPEERFELFNCGAGGDTAQGTLRRLEEDILIHHPTIATVMLGMNDIWWENKELIGSGDYIRDVEILIEHLQAHNCRILLITPSPYDGTVQSDTPQDPLREGLEQYAVQLRKIASQKQIPILDYFGLMTEMTAQKQRENPAFTLLGRDRVHPAQSGHLVMAYYFLKHQNCPSLVSEIVLDTSSKDIVRQTNCRIKEMQFAADSISWSALENALPFPVDGLSEDSLSLVPFVQDFDQQVLKIKGLQAKRYELIIDGQSVGDYTSEALAKGVNIAVNRNTPQYKQAQRVSELNTLRHSVISQKLRYITMIEHGELKQVYMQDDVVEPRKAIEQRIAGITDEKTAEAQKKKFNRYLECKAEQSKLAEKAERYLEEMWKINKPVWHNYQVCVKASQDHSSVVTHDITSPYQQGNTPVHILLPKSYDPQKKYRVLYVLPVGRGIYSHTAKWLETIDIHNRYDLIIAFPNMTVTPWFGDHVSDPEIRQESYMKECLVPFVEAHYSTYGNKEGRLLIGFSKSGWGAFSLLLRNPDFFGYAASWDAPMFSDKLVYGMQANYGTIEQMKRYEPSRLLQQKKECFTDGTRFVLIGEDKWGQLQPSPKGISHTSEMYELFKSTGVGVIYDNNLDLKHTWDSRWLEPAVQYLLELAENKNKIKVNEMKIQ